MFDDLVDSGAGPGINARAGHHLHQVEDLVPAGLIEAELQYISRRMTGRAIVHEDPLDARIVRCRFRQCRGEHLTRQLPDPLFRVGYLLEHKILMTRGAQVHRTLGSLEAKRLRPDAIFACGQRREIIAAGLVGIDTGRDGRSFHLGRYRHAFQLLACARRDGAGQELIGCLGSRNHNHDGRGSKQETSHVSHNPLLIYSLERSSDTRQLHRSRPAEENT